MKLVIRQYGDPVLRQKGREIREIDERLRELAVNMIETMAAANGVGLAAHQVGEASLITVIDVSRVEDRPSTLKIEGKQIDPASMMPLVLLNPRLKLHDETVLGVEGCLSFPEITADIERAEVVEVEALTLKGNLLKFEAGGLLARALQHEVDHLNGVLFIDRMNSAARAALESRLKRLRKETVGR